MDDFDAVENDSLDFGQAQNDDQKISVTDELGSVVLASETVGNTTLTAEVKAPLARVWPILKDVPRVAVCMPHAQITETVDGRTYRAKVSVRVGPISANYAATLHVESIDDSTHTEKITLQGDEVKGIALFLHSPQSPGEGRAGVRATITLRAEDQGDTTRLTLHTNAAIGGVVAGVGGRLIESVAQKMLAQFAANLSSLASTAPSSDQGQISR